MVVQSVKDGVVKSYGEGEYIGDKVPDMEPFKSLNIENPCIKLDTGKYVWGFMCWWGGVESCNLKFEGMEIIPVEVEEEVLPVEIEQAFEEAEIVE